MCKSDVPAMGNDSLCAVVGAKYSGIGTLLKMGRYYNTTMCHYWDMSVK